MTVERADLGKLLEGDAGILHRRRRSQRQVETARRVAIFEWLRSVGVYCWRQGNGASYSEAKGCWIRQHGRDWVEGISDLGGILPDGSALQVEVKSEHGRASVAQLEHIKRVNQAGRAVAFVARSVIEAEARLADAGWIVRDGQLVRSRGCDTPAPRTSGRSARPNQPTGVKPSLASVTCGEREGVTPSQAPGRRS